MSGGDRPPALLALLAVLVVAAVGMGGLFEQEDERGPTSSESMAAVRASLDGYLQALADSDLEAAFEQVCTSGVFATTREAFMRHHQAQPAVTGHRVYLGSVSAGGRSRGSVASTTGVVADVTFEDGVTLEGISPLWHPEGLCGVSSPEAEVERVDPTPDDG